MKTLCPKMTVELEAPRSAKMNKVNEVYNKRQANRVNQGPIVQLLETDFGIIVF